MRLQLIAAIFRLLRRMSTVSPCPEYAAGPLWRLVQFPAAFPKLPVGLAQSGPGASHAVVHHRSERAGLDNPGPGELLQGPSQALNN